MEQMKCTAGMLFSFGVTDLCSYYALFLGPESERKPGQFSIGEYRTYTEFAARLNSLFTSGRIETRVAVLYPIVSLWSHFTPSNRSMYEPHPNPKVRHFDGAFTDLCRSLLQQQIDYDIVDERSLAAATIEGEHRWLWGSDGIRCCFFLPLTLFDFRRWRRFAGLSKAGDRSLHTHESRSTQRRGPQADAQINDMIQEIRAAGALGGIAPGSPPISYLVRSRITPDCELTPSSPNILCTTIRRTEGPAYFIVNVSSEGYAGTCTFQAAGEAYLFDPSTGEERPVQTEEANGQLVRTSLNLRPFESLCVLVR